MKNIAQAALSLLHSGESFALATILTSSGSTPRGAGSSMIVRSDKSITGTVGGGILEGVIIKTAEDVISGKKSQACDYVLNGKDAALSGAICGGSAKVLIDYIDANNLQNLAYFEQLFNACGSGSRSYIATLIPDSGNLQGRSQCLILSDGSSAGTDGFDKEIVAKLEARNNSYDVFTRLENWQVYLTPIGSDGTVYIFGAGHCGEKLAHVLHTVGFATVVIDDRTEFANSQRFPEADDILIPESLDLPFNDIQFDDDSYIVIVTRGHAQDELVLRRALRTNAGYVGMIGSRAKRETIYKHMLADGYTQEDINKVYSPIGISIGAETPEEIAISITAELIRVRAEKKQIS
jgi:xanthine dehydrogenase accessory factor